MKKQTYILKENELKKFEKFVEEHTACSKSESLVVKYNIKLVFNVAPNQEPLPTCYCSSCGEEELLADQVRYKDF